MFINLQCLSFVLFVFFCSVFNYLELAAGKVHCVHLKFIDLISVSIIMQLPSFFVVSLAKVVFMNSDEQVYFFVHEKIIQSSANS